jgi:hypothetical protein
VIYARCQLFTRFILLDSSYDEDITIDIQAFKLMIDPQIIDRLENYVYGFKNLNKPEKKG